MRFLSRSLVVLSGVALAAGAGCKAGGGAGVAASEPSTDDQKAFYALGFQLSTRMQVFNLKPDELGYVMRGLQDGVQGKKSAVDMQSFGPKIQQLAMGRSKERLAEEKKAAVAFLEAAAKESGAEKLPSGLIYKQITAGTGESPKATDRVKVHYHGTLRDGKVFDSSVERKEPATFPLNGVIPCWTEGVQLMKVGGKAKLTCPSEIAYGDQGRPGIPPGAVLTFEVELLSIEQGPPSPAPGSSMMTPPGMHPMPGGAHPMPGGAHPMPGAPPPGMHPVSPPPPGAKPPEPAKK
jgi:FKBP-type peptidyl-prolyl cis-trans isomerase FkpA